MSRNGGLNLMSTAVISPTSFEAACVRRAKAGDNCAFFELVKVFARRIFSIAKHITQNDNDAEDVLIQTFLEVYSDLDECREDQKFWVWLVTIAVREAFSKLRHRGEGRPLPDPVDEDVVIRESSVWGDRYQQRYSLEQTTGILEHAMRSLDPMCRAVFVLRDIEEISVEHVARVLNRSVAAVEVCLLRARLQLREMLTRELGAAVNADTRATITPERSLNSALIQDTA